jgi:hypothetical protein
MAYADTFLKVTPCERKNPEWDASAPAWRVITVWPTRVRAISVAPPKTPVTALSGQMSAGMRHLVNTSS